MGIMLESGEISLSRRISSAPSGWLILPDSNNNGTHIFFEYKTQTHSQGRNSISGKFQRKI